MSIMTTLEAIFVPLPLKQALNFGIPCLDVTPIFSELPISLAYQKHSGL